MKTSRAHWSESAIFYHIYPLGMLGAEKRNLPEFQTKQRITELKNWIPYLLDLGINSIYLGPLFESTSHGYDIADYYQVDRRLGTNDDLKNVFEALKNNGIKIVLDAVFNHVGREFFAFKDILHKQQQSPYCRWISGLDFGKKGFDGDNFFYNTWNGHKQLVKLDLACNETKQYIFNVVAFWIKEFGINGLRLDAADVIDLHFLSELSGFCNTLDSEFWLMGEVIHGDYRNWTEKGGLHSLTNYETYKSMYSSLNDENYFELAWTLGRQNGTDGIYRDINLYNFCDNHDVNRIASQLNDRKHLYPLYLALFTIPGIPSIYYGSENGLTGKRDKWADHMLRPQYRLNQAEKPNDIKRTIKRLINIRKEYSQLSQGDYREESIAHKQLAFSRTDRNGRLYIILNADDREVQFPVPSLKGRYFDILNNEECCSEGIVSLYPDWGRILIRK